MFMFKRRGDFMARKDEVCVKCGCSRLDKCDDCRQYTLCEKCDFCSCRHCYEYKS